MSDPYILGTRGSALALTQSTLAAEHIVQVFNTHSREHGAERTLSFDITTVKTDGDVLTGPLATLGGTGVFAAALRQRLLDGDTPGGVDVAVHSLKDLPAEPCPGLVIAAILEREDPRDALVARDNLTLDTLPTGARVGTGSPRRAAQVRALRPDLEIVDIRGNVGTRIARVKGLEEHGNRQVVVRDSAETDEAAHRGIGTENTGDCDAVILAVSGLKRLGKESVITEYLDPSRMLPAPGQGALAIEPTLRSPPNVVFCAVLKPDAPLLSVPMPPSKTATLCSQQLSHRLTVPKACATRPPPVSLMFPALNDWVFALPKTCFRWAPQPLPVLR